MSLLTSAATEIGKFVKFEYTGSWFRIVVEIFRCRLVLPRDRATSWRKQEPFRREMLQKVIHKIGETSV